ncbi:hypothetical protein JTE90_014237 [Oedothorax gibbosus]|uniref:Tektin n=1 Tax=Oedothorax gibbosus TaxID=931172 RepID=A0AAV6TJZ1_9ARAC|nr:hypothetical protein JTE90_014237 [Oedothorax gibbosus]
MTISQFFQIFPFLSTARGRLGEELENKLQDAAAVRRESSTARLRTESALSGALGNVADTYGTATRAIEEEVQRDERTLFDIRNTLEEIGKEILWTKQRAASLLDNLRLEERGKTRQLWRLQTLTYRPGPDHIRDGPARRCDAEMLSAEQRSAFASGKLETSRDLLARLQHEKDRQTLALEKIAKKLFIERENCLGIRRTIKLEGRS